jgi:hypothetical protein
MTHEKRTRDLTDDEIFQMMEQAALHEYPNPDRIGCPDEETLKTFARDPKSFPISDSIFDHVMQCSPCFRFIQKQKLCAY